MLASSLHPDAHLIRRGGGLASADASAKEKVSSVPSSLLCFVAQAPPCLAIKLCTSARSVSLSSAAPLGRAEPTQPAEPETLALALTETLMLACASTAALSDAVKQAAPETPTSPSAWK